MRGGVARVEDRGAGQNEKLGQTSRTASEGTAVDNAKQGDVAANAQWSQAEVHQRIDVTDTDTAQESLCAGISLE